MRTNDIDRTAGTLLKALAPDGQRRRRRTVCVGRERRPLLRERVPVIEAFGDVCRWRAAWRRGGARRADIRRPFIEEDIRHVMSRSMLVWEERGASVDEARSMSRCLRQVASNDGIGAKPDDSPNAWPDQTPFKRCNAHCQSFRSQYLFQSTLDSLWVFLGRSEQQSRFSCLSSSK